jgi:putative addiction module component (TIGR02574 family)
MSNYDSVLSAAAQLPTDDRVRLIRALWDTVPDDAEASWDEAWLNEIDRRMDRLEHGSPTTPWSEVRDAAFSRLRSGQDH